MCSNYNNILIIIILINSNSLQLAAIVRYVVEQVALDPEVRSRLLSDCDGISNLVDWLDSINRRPGLSELDTKLSSIEVNISALKQCIGYAEDGYQRNVIKKTEHYELVAICWTPGQLTPCLLYTSPSPRDGLLSRMPSSA